MEKKKVRKLLIVFCSVAACIIAAVVLCLLFFRRSSVPLPEPDFSVERWTANEMNFTSTIEYDRPFYDVDVSVVFKNLETGKKLTIPCFWDGGSVWRARYALTEEGIWEYETKCSDSQNAGLNDAAGTVACKAYTGDQEIYQHGFVKTEKGTRYFTYDDGTPFFYLGDTHWHMVLEEIDSRGEYCDDASITSRFKYTIDTRKEQGFTVIQSEPLGQWTAKGGNSYFAGIFEEFSEELLEQFQLYDKYFAYIAEKGLVHANAQFSYPDYIGKYMKTLSDEDLARLCRYWVARYSAYPVMWTMAQECDNDYYNDRGDQYYFNWETNPWKKVAQYIYENDPYKHPLTAHQEHTSYTTASTSAFREVEGHTWYASQCSWDLQNGIPFHIFKDYWENGQEKVSVLYEGKYDHFWTGTTGARFQGWVAYLNGMYGYGYGSQKIWSANEAPGIWAGAIQNGYEDGYDSMTYDDMNLSWMESLQLPAAAQMGYMKNFFSALEWWKLIPTFGTSKEFAKDNGRVNYVMARDGAETVVIYFMHQTTYGGTVKRLDEGEYHVTWFNPRTGEKSVPQKLQTEDGRLSLGEKPDKYDWVVLVQKA